MDRTVRARALCLEYDPDTWFPVGSSGPALMQAEQAKAICRQCPIRAECLECALIMNCWDGVWGGFDESERRAMVRANGVVQRGPDEDHRTRTALVRELAS